MGIRKYLLFTVIVILCLTATTVSAQTIIYIPIDDRPVNMEYVIETAKAAGVDIVTPPASLIGSHSNQGKPDSLWEWLFEHAKTADNIVLATDTLLYGNLITSRTHNLPAQVIADRLTNFDKLKALNPNMKLYIFSTIMRSPKAVGGWEEPAYYKIYGPNIFRICALRDKAETQELTQDEKSELSALLDKVPQSALADWYDRREKNFSANQRLLAYAQTGTFTYFILGRDDCWPYSQSHMEARHLAAETTKLPTSSFGFFPGTDELGMLLVTRAINKANDHTPTIRVLFAPGTGPETVPSYQDVPVGQTINENIIAAGGKPVDSEQADLILAVNTPGDGITYESDNALNRGQFRAEPVVLVWDIAYEMKAGHKVAVADITFANGADNTLMSELSKRDLLFKLESYSGWNTAGNTIGYAIGQGMLAGKMAPEAKNRLLAVRYLDDWAYQANVRAAVGREVLYPRGGSWFSLGKLSSRMTTETDRRLQSFAAVNFPTYPLKNFKVSFPLDRMFEVKVELH